MIRPLRLAMLSLDWVRQKDPKISLGHASLLAMLRKYNATDCEVIDSRWAVNQYSDIRELSRNVLNDILPHRPDVIAIGCFVWNETHVQRILADLSKNSGGQGLRPKVLLGGPQVSYAPQGTLETFYPTADYFIRGYAEAPLSKFATAWAKAQDIQRSPLMRGKKLAALSIQGLHEAGTFDENRQAETALERVPSPFLSADNRNPPIIDLNRSFLRWETVRGCRFACGFCQHRDAKSDPQSLSAGRVKREIEAMCHSQVNDIAVLDPVFNSPSSQYLSVLDEFIANKFSGRITFQAKFDMVTPSFLDRCSRLMYDLGARVELEFGLQTIHPVEMQAANRTNNLRAIKHRVAPELRARGIPFSVSLIYGLPYQTVTSFGESLAFAEQLGPFEVAAFPLMLLRGTPMEQKKRELGLVEALLSHVDPSIEELPYERIVEGIPHVIASPTFTRDDWKIMNKMAKAVKDDNKRGIIML